MRTRRSPFMFKQRADREGNGNESSSTPKGGHQYYVKGYVTLDDLREWLWEEANTKIEIT